MTVTSFIRQSLELREGDSSVIIAVHVIFYFFYVVMYGLFVLSVHEYYVNYNAKAQMGYLCALIK
jgi:hypothetical protein